MKKVKQIILSVVVLIGVGSLAFTTPTVKADCGTVKTSIISCPKGTDNSSKDITKTGAGSLLVMAIQIMTAGVGVLAVGGIIYGAVLYVSAADSAEQVKKARTVITNVIIGIVAYGLMYAILNFIIPGGLF